MRLAVYIYSIPIIDADVDDASVASDRPVTEQEYTSGLLEALIAEEGVQRTPYMLTDGQVTMMEDYVASLERHA